MYKSSKGAVQFPLDKPLPLTLITKVVKWRVKEDGEHTLEIVIPKAGLEAYTFTFG